MYYDMLDAGIWQWLTTFGSPARVLGAQLLTTPYWRVLDGSSELYCTNGLPPSQQSSYCVANCLSNLDQSAWFCIEPQHAHQPAVQRERRGGAAGGGEGVVPVQPDLRPQQPRAAHRLQPPQRLQLLDVDLLGGLLRQLRLPERGQQQIQ